MQQTVSIYSAKAHLSRLIAEVERSGRPLTITRHKRPIVDIIVHMPPRDPLEQCNDLKGARFCGDPLDPIGEEDWPEELR